MQKYRVFIAIELPERIKNSLNLLQDKLKGGGKSFVKWVDPEGIHVTLKFLGDVAVDKVSLITGEMEKASLNTASFQLEIKGLGAFPNINRPQVVWAGISGEVNTLKELHDRIENNLSRLGYPPEKRDYSPHITLARLRDSATLEERQSIGKIISQIKMETNLIIPVHCISLMRSELTRAGAVYTRLSSVELNPPCQ